MRGCSAMEEGMKASVLYMVRFWVSPEEGKPFLDWLNGGHIAEVVREPGFLWARQYQLEGLDENGWRAHITVYGVDTLESFKNYLNSRARERFMQESEQFKGLFRAERLSGPVDVDLPSPGHTGEEEAQAVYCVRFSVSPKSHRAFLEWLNSEHMAEVVRQPGFLWARRVHLEERDEDGWERYIIIYGKSTHETLREYLNNHPYERFPQQCEPLFQDLRKENFYGTLELAL